MIYNDIICNNNDCFMFVKYDKDIYDFFEESSYKI